MSRWTSVPVVLLIALLSGVSGWFLREWQMNRLRQDVVRAVHLSDDCSDMVTRCVGIVHRLADTCSRAADELKVCRARDAAELRGAP